MSVRNLGFVFICVQRESTRVSVVVKGFLPPDQDRVLFMVFMVNMCNKSENFFYLVELNILCLPSLEMDRIPG